jgi:hypothetical protein
MELQLRCGTNDVKNTVAGNQIFRFSDLRLCSSQVHSLRDRYCVRAHSRHSVAKPNYWIQQNLRSRSPMERHLRRSSVSIASED